MEDQLDIMESNIQDCFERKSLKLVLRDYRATELPAQFFECTHVKDLDLSGNFLSSKALQQLSTFNNLRWLNLSHTFVDDISFLKPLAQIHTIDFSNTLVSDVSVLKNLKNLYEIKLDECEKLTDISALRSLPFLYRLSIVDSSVSSLLGFGTAILQRRLDISLNPQTMEYPNSQICEGGMEAIRRHFSLAVWMEMADEDENQNKDQ